MMQFLFRVIRYSTIAADSSVRVFPPCQGIIALPPLDTSESERSRQHLAVVPSDALPQMNSPDLLPGGYGVRLLHVLLE